MGSASTSDDTLDGPKQLGNENATIDFNSNWYNGHSWLEYLVEDKTTYCYKCQKFICKEFVFSNLKKAERLIKHLKDQDHSIAMAK